MEAVLSSAPHGLLLPFVRLLRYSSTRVLLPLSSAEAALGRSWASGETGAWDVHAAHVRASTIGPALRRTRSTSGAGAYRLSRHPACVSGDLLECGPWSGGRRQDWSAFTLSEARHPSGANLGRVAPGSRVAGIAGTLLPAV